MKGTDRVHPAVLAALSLAGGDGDLRSGRSPGGGGPGLRHRIGAPGEPHRGAREPVRHGGQAAVRGPGGHRLRGGGPARCWCWRTGSRTRRWVAADLLAQAEHDPDARSVLVSLDEGLAVRVEEAVRRQLETLSTAPVARAAWEAGGEIWIAGSPEEAREFANLAGAGAPGAERSGPGDLDPCLAQLRIPLRGRRGGGGLRGLRLRHQPHPAHHGGGAVHRGPVGWGPSSRSAPSSASPPRERPV